MKLRSSEFLLRVQANGVVQIYSVLFSTILTKDYERLILSHFGVENWKTFLSKYKIVFKYVDSVLLCRLFLDFDTLSVKVLD